jgi:protein-arginine kinase activator protein McsA
MSEKSSSAETKLRCHICGKRFKKGATRYRINLEIVSDFDGYIEDVSKKPEGHLEEKIGEILKETGEMSEQELEEEIYLKRNWRVCVNCRERFLTVLKKLCE